MVSIGSVDICDSASDTPLYASKPVSPRAQRLELVTNQPFRAGRPECAHGRPGRPKRYHGQLGPLALSHVRQSRQPVMSRSVISSRSACQQPLGLSAAIGRGAAPSV
ncbi:hypothetical protein Y032_0150g2745 [Ancylostoma ceylanicum]|uniref:Uncharacterized protein n=1 Tax=Ancylostoma ceylanicum TaxID=53326 RepID=A0A016T1G2_9BILA|nr:hypothetical protein Y032_0150g2745 [Ancylostoma ceylanicum]